MNSPSSSPTAMNEAMYWSAPRQHLTTTPEVQQETEVYSTHNRHSSGADVTPPPTPPDENDKDKFQCLYLLSEAAVAVQKMERERERALRV